MNIEKGLKFRSKWFEGTVEVHELDTTTNELKVKITSPLGYARYENWNLAHTRVGFSQGDYKRLTS